MTLLPSFLLFYIFDYIHTDMKYLFFNIDKKKQLSINMIMNTMYHDLYNNILLSKLFLNNIIDTSIENEDIYTLLWLHEKNGLPNNICNISAQKGKLKVLSCFSDYGYYHDEYISILAAEGNHKNILEWMIENNMNMSKETLYVVAENGNLELFKMLYKTKNFPIDDEILNFAAAFGHLEILKFIYEKYRKLNNDVKIYAIVNEYNDILSWLNQMNI